MQDASLMLDLIAAFFTVCYLAKLLFDSSLLFEEATDSVHIKRSLLRQNIAPKMRMA